MPSGDLLIWSRIFFSRGYSSPGENIWQNNRIYRNIFFILLISHFRSLILSWISTFLSTQLRIKPTGSPVATRSFKSCTSPVKYASLSLTYPREIGFTFHGIKILRGPDSGNWFQFYNDSIINHGVSVTFSYSILSRCKRDCDRWFWLTRFLSCLSCYPVKCFYCGELLPVRMGSDLFSWQRALFC